MGEKVGLSPEDARQIAGLVAMIKGYPRPKEGVSLENVVTGARVPEDFRDMLQAIQTILDTYHEDIRGQEVLRLLPVFDINVELPPQAD